MIQACTHHSAIVVHVTTVTLTIIVGPTHEHFCKTPEMSIADVLSHWNKAWAEAKGWT